MELERQGQMLRSVSLAKLSKFYSKCDMKETVKSFKKRSLCQVVYRMRLLGKRVKRDHGG